MIVSGKGNVHVYILFMLGLGLFASVNWYMSVFIEASAELQRTEGDSESESGSESGSGSESESGSEEETVDTLRERAVAGSTQR